MIEQNNKSNKLVGIFSYYIIPLLLAVLLFSGSGEMLFDQLDTAALVLFVFTLLAKPMAVVFKMDFFWKVVNLRKELGNLVFWLFTFHLAGMLMFAGMNMNLGMDNMFQDMTWGIAAWVLMFIMAILSNNYVGNMVKADWSKLRFMSFLALLFMLLHLGTQEKKIFEATLAFAAWAILKTVEFVKLKKTTGSIR